jgi:hypothetical protein
VLESNGGAPIQLTAEERRRLDAMRKEIDPEILKKIDLLADPSNNHRPITRNRTDYDRYRNPTWSRRRSNILTLGGHPSGGGQVTGARISLVVIVASTARCLGTFGPLQF